MSIPLIDLAVQQKLIQKDLRSRIDAVLAHGQYIMGPEVQELEQTLARYVGAKHGIALSSGTDALLIALMALDIKPGDEVITTPFTFMATGEMIALLGAVPVFADIDPRTYNLDPRAAEKAITSKTRAIVPVSLYGQCADFDAFNDIGRRHDLPIIEDAAQSFGATYKGRRSCGLSLVSCTSFFPSKPLGGYGDGGACFTSDDDLAQKMREIRNHGQERRYYHTRLGLNGRLDTLQAAILLSKFALFSNEVEARVRIGARYTESILQRLSGKVVPPHVDPTNQSVYAQYTVAVPDRERVQKKLESQGVSTAVHYPLPLNKQPIFQELPERFPLTNADRASHRVLSLPMHAYLTESDQDKVVDALEIALKEL